ncbi:MAG TPA: LysE family translocator [Roseiarcus sp.]|nr:LysE family translocator [Roseiarcus sp.]
MSELWRPLASLLLASVVVMGSPGPSTISATAVGAAFGFRRSFPYVCGLVAGTAAALLLVAIGVVALLVATPYAARALSLAAAAYILFLAFKIATAPPLDRGDRPAAAPKFLAGFLLAVANPKAYLAIAAVFAGATVVADDHGLDAIVKTLLLALMIVIIHGFWLMLGSSLSRVLHDPKNSRIINVALAGALVIATAAALIS